MFRGLLTKHSQSAIVAASAISGFTLVSLIVMWYWLIIVSIALYCIDCIDIQRELSWLDCISFLSSRNYKWSRLQFNTINGWRWRWRCCSLIHGHEHGHEHSLYYTILLYSLHYWSQVKLSWVECSIKLDHSFIAFILILTLIRYCILILYCIVCIKLLESINYSIIYSLDWFDW